MIRQIRAFAWLRWRLLINGVRGAKRRDTLEQISRILAMVAPAMIVVASLGSVIALSVGGVLAGSALARGGVGADVAIIVFRCVLVAQLGLVTLMPMGLGTQSAARYTRFLLLPVPQRLLHALEVASGIADPWIFAILPGLVLLTGALVAGGAWTTALVAALAGVGFVFLLLSVSALISFLTAWLMRDRRRAELSTLLLVMGLSLAAVVPQMLGLDAARERRADREAGRSSRSFSLETVEAALPSWTRLLPSEMTGRAVMFAARGDVRSALGWTAGVWATGAALFLVSLPVYRRLLAANEGQSRRRRAAAPAGTRRLPLVPPDLSAVALTQWRTGVRSVRGRLALLLPGPMLALLSLVMARAPEEAPWIARIPEFGHLVFGAGLIFIVYALQPFTMNQFASDRAGLTLQWLLPISSRSLVWGKALGTFLMFATAGAISLVVILATNGSGPLLLWLAVAAAGTAVFASMTPIAAVMSALFPVAADLSKTGSGGNPHGAAILAGTFLVLLCAGPPLLIIILGPRWGGGLTLLLSLGWLAFVLCGAIPLLAAAARVVDRRRENLFLTVKA